MTRNITLIIAMMLSMIANVANAQNPKRSELTIVDKVEVKLEAKEARHINNSQRVTVDLTDALAKLGGGGLGMALHKFYIAEYDEQTEGKTDELTSEYNYREGWWLTDIYDETTGEMTGECSADTLNDSSMYLRGLVLDGKQLSMTVGQVAGAMKVGSTYFALLYYINGSNAIEIAVSLTITEAEMPKLADLTKVGEENYDVSMYYNGSYKYRVIDFPADSLYEAIYATLPQPDCVGSEEAPYWDEEMQLVLYAQSAENILTDEATAFYGGFWFDADGYACPYGEKATFFCEPEDWSMNALHVGIYPNYGLIGSSLKATLYVVGADSYYKINVSVAVQPQPTFAQCELVETFTYAMEIVPDATAEHTTDIKLVQDDYMVRAITLEHGLMKELLDEGTYEFCVENTLLDNDGNIIKNYNSAFSNLITRGKGYLMMNTYGLFQSEELLHIAASLSPFPMMTKAYGIGYEQIFIETDTIEHTGYYEDCFSFWYQPGDAAVGDYYQNVFYLVNYDSGKKVKINLNVIYVDQRNPIYDIIGTADVELPQSNAEGNDYGTMTIDLTEMMTALECTNINDIQWAAYNNLGQLLVTSDFDEIYGYNFDANGWLTSEATKVFSVGFADGTFHSLLSNGTGDTDYTTTIVAVYNGKGYKFNVKVTKDPQNDTGIQQIMHNSQFIMQNGIYDLFGHKLSAPIKGINIINGKKVLVK